MYMCFSGITICIGVNLIFGHSREVQFVHVRNYYVLIFVLSKHSTQCSVNWLLVYLSEVQYENISDFKLVIMKI